MTKTTTDTDEQQELRQVLQHLAPWLEKTGSEVFTGSWETALATRMMLNLLQLWLTADGRKRVQRLMAYYHPLDRAAMAYALLVYMLTGRRLTFRSAVANQHFRVAARCLMADMPQLTFARHLKHMLRRYGNADNENNQS